MGDSNSSSPKDGVSLGYQQLVGAVFLRAQRRYVGNELARRPRSIPLPRAPRGDIARRLMAADMSAKSPNRPSLTVDTDPRRPAGGVSVRNLEPDLMVSLDRHLEAGGLLNPCSESVSFEGQPPMVTIFPTFLATITSWKTVF